MVGTSNRELSRAWNGNCTCPAAETSRRPTAAEAHQTDMQGGPHADHRHRANHARVSESEEVTTAPLSHRHHVDRLAGG